MAATSASNAWAVGWTGDFSEGTGQNTLIEHWNGKRWHRVSSPSPAGTGSFLAGVATINPRNIFAVGYYNSDNGTFPSLIEHWNGGRWAVVHSPNPTGNTDMLAVTATSPWTAWAVGYTHPFSCNPQCSTAVFHFNGKVWKAVPSPSPASGGPNTFAAVAAISARDAWAVGTVDYASTLIAHWNGSAWSN